MMNSGLSFFKVISSCQQMDFPPESVARLQGILGRRVTLRDVNKNLWNIKVEKGRDGYFFNKGWPQFYHENSLEPHDIVVFNHKHENLFDFKLFGRNACEKIGLVKEEAKEVEELITDHDDDDDGDYVKEELISDDDDDDGDYVKEELESEEENYATQIGRFKEEEIKIEVKEEDEDLAESDDYDENEEGNNKEKKASPSSLRQKKHNVGDYYGHDIFKFGLATQPKNPYFVSRSRKSRKNELCIPREVLLCLSLEIPSRLFLVDESGRRWETKIKKWTDGRVWCTGGWKRMCRVNNIGINDTCICEFVQEHPDPDPDHLYMHVRVVDAVAVAAAASASASK